MKKILLAYLLLLFAAEVNAQQMLGLASSNYAGITRMQRSPSSIADSRSKFSFFISSFDVNITNNYVGYGGSDALYKVIKEGQSLESENLQVISNDRPKLMNASLDYTGPGFMVMLSQKHSVGLTTRVRGGLSFNNVSAPIAELIRAGTTSDELLNKVYDNNQISMNANVNAELNLTYARVLLNSKTQFLKAGVTLKKVTGIYSAHFINENIDYQVSEKAYPAPSTETYHNLEIRDMQAQFGYMNEDFMDGISPAKALGWVVKSEAPGNGWGADVGFTYEYRPDFANYISEVDGKTQVNNRKNKYKYRFSANLLDLGKVVYSQENLVRGYKIDAQNKQIDLNTFENAESLDDYAAIVDKELGAGAIERKTEFTSGLPTALNLDLDYHVGRKFYANATVFHNLRGKYAISMRQNSLLAVTPRFETKLLELALPVSLYNNYQLVGVGAMVRVGGFFVGSDNIGGLFNVGRPYGSNLYAGFSILNFSRGKIKKVKETKVKPVKKA